MMSAQLQGQQQMRYDLDQLKDLTQGVKYDLTSSINQMQQDSVTYNEIDDLRRD